MGRRVGQVIALAGACTLLAACGAPVDDRPVVRIEAAAQPVHTRPLAQVLPTAQELSATVVAGPANMMGQQVAGGPDMLLAGIASPDAAPAECVGTVYQLQKASYPADAVRAVASQSWTGGDLDKPTTGYFGAVEFRSPDAAQTFFAGSAQKWRRCNGQSVVLHQPPHGGATSRINDVAIDAAVDGGHLISAVVLPDEVGASPLHRALGVSSDRVVDVQVSGSDGVDAGDAVRIARLMLAKVAAP